MSIEDILREELTEPQYDAATDPSAEILTIACAGSGKSRTLAYRIAWLVDAGAPPDSIVAFTFTEKAADSIKLQTGRALARAGLEPTVLGAMFIGTIHSYCKAVLGDMDARYRQFEVLDENRLKLYLISRYYDLGLNGALYRRAGGRYFECIKQVSDAWKLVNDELVDLDALDQHDPELGEVLLRLAQRLAQDHYIDFSLMIRLVAEALQAGDPAALRVLEPLQHLMVDEYQDVNPSQEVLIEQMHQRSETLFVVGDDDQALYAWRGADVSHILDFRTRYPGASEHTLDTNFRSTSAIVTAADGFARAELGPVRMDKNPVADASPEPRDFRRLWFDARPDEAEWVTDSINRLLGSEYRERDDEVRGLTPGDFAVLMRSTRYPEGRGGPPRHAAFTQALEDAGISFTLEAGGSIFDRAPVNALRGSFELLRNGAPTRAEATAVFDTEIRPAYPHADFTRFARVLTAWAREIHTPPGGARRRVYPQRLVHELLDALGIQDTEFDAGTMHDVGMFSRVIQDAESVYMSIDSPGRFRAILNFLQQVAEYGYDTGTDDVVARPDAVTISTVHQVKGLEYPVVFVVDVESQRFPRRRGNYRGWVPQAVIGDAIRRGAYQSTPEEEARLFYTAITRAERFLYVSGSEQLPGRTRPARVSPYALRLAHDELSDSPDGVADGFETAAQRPRIDETIMPTTYSDIRYYLRCPRDYLYRKIYGFSPPITDLFGYGQTIHAAIGKLHERFPEAAPSAEEAVDVAREMFHLKHVPPSGDPENNAGPYERALDSATEILANYAGSYGGDFARTRTVEARFEIPLGQAVISGSIDLMLREDEEGNILEAEVIDFKSMKGGENPEESEKLDWTELVLQVQLYAFGAREVLGENARTGYVHLLKDNQRVEVPVDDAAVAAALANVEWSVGRVLASDFPMRPEPTKCADCDFAALCPKRPESFSTNEMPPPLHIPAEAGEQAAAAVRLA